MSDENRKLAAITFIDIVGYTAMMGQNVDLTLEKVDSVRSIIQDSVGEYHGELLKEMGDGFLLRFASTSNAIKSAISIQQQAKKLTIKIC